MNPITLIVVHWNQPDECLATIAALRAQEVPLQVIVADNHSRAEEWERLRAGTDDSIELVRLDENKGWGGALNIVLQKWLAAPGPELCLISAHDTEPQPNCLPLLVAAMEKNPKLGIACPQYPAPDLHIARLSARRGVYQQLATAQPAGVAQPVEAPHGTLMIVRRACLEAIGLFDERYFAYGDEHELGARAIRNGWQVAMVWGAIVVNPGTWTSSPLRSYLFARNSLLLVRDYFGTPAALIRAALILLNTFRLIVRSPSRAFAFSPLSRLRAVKDFLLGRTGRPHFLR